MDLRPLTDAALLARLDELVRQERECSADVIEHLLEAERRELALDAGYSSLFEYCVKQLGYSEAGAFLRIRASRAARRFPRTLADLRTGAITLDTIARLYPHLNDENKDRVLDLAAGAPKPKVLALVAGLGGGSIPQRDVVRPLPAPEAAAPPQEGLLGSPPAAADNVIPPPTRFRFQFTADDELVVMIGRLRGLLRHRHPEGRLEDVFKAAVNIALSRLDPALTNKAKKPPCPTAGSRRVPESIKRAVWHRDQGRCAFVSDEGRRCERTEHLEYDHVVPWALGGSSVDARNIRLLCRAHNQRLARRRFGRRRTVSGHS